MYLFFDTETNGLPKNFRSSVAKLSNWPRLVQIAWILFDENGNQLDQNDHIIKPQGFSIPKNAARIHGITTSRAKREGIDLKECLQEFYTQIEKTTFLIAHNMRFDEKIMGSELLRSGFENLLPAKKRVCTMLKTTDFCGIFGDYGYKWPKLQELHYKLFGEGFEDAHNASADVNATARCFWELRRRELI